MFPGILLEVRKWPIPNHMRRERNLFKHVKHLTCMRLLKWHLFARSWNSGWVHIVNTWNYMFSPLGWTLWYIVHLNQIETQSVYVCVCVFVCVHVCVLAYLLCSDTCGERNGRKQAIKSPAKAELTVHLGQARICIHSTAAYCSSKALVNT